MQKAQQLAPNLAEIALEQGMLKKFQRQYREAIPYFERAVQLDRTQWIAAAQVAHCKMFVGRPDEAYDEMEAVMPNLLPDIGAAEVGLHRGRNRPGGRTHRQGAALSRGRHQR
jgi:tetratricopeptide (TPR) repeat protein